MTRVSPTQQKMGWLKMRIKDKILFKYFLSDDHFKNIIAAAEQEKEDILESAYSHATFTETGIVVTGSDVESAVVAAIMIDERIERIKQSIAKSQELFKKALRKVDTRQRIILFVYFNTGIILTNKYELHRAQEFLIDVLEALKQKEDSHIKKEYMQQFKQL